MTISAIEQQIYNCHLKHFRNGNPWKPRKDFSDISDTTILYLKKLHLFFQKFSHINWDDFFGAPKALHPDEPTPPLQFFITRAAIKSYTLYQKLLLDQNPDHQIDKIKESFKYIVNFCLQNKILFDDYINHKNGIMASWMEHYRLHLINPYSLMEFNLNIDKLELDETELWIPNLVENFTSFKARYHNSLNAKNLVKTLYNKMKTLVSEELKKKSFDSNINP